MHLAGCTLNRKQQCSNYPKPTQTPRKPTNQSIFSPIYQTKNKLKKNSTRRISTPPLPINPHLHRPQHPLQLPPQHLQLRNPLLPLPLHAPQLPLQLPDPPLLLRLRRINPGEHRNQILDLLLLDDEVAGEFALAGCERARGVRLRREGRVCYCAVGVGGLLGLGRGRALRGGVCCYGCCWGGGWCWGRGGVAGDFGEEGRRGGFLGGGCCGRVVVVGC